LRSSSNNGKVYVKVQNGFEIDELHKVYALNPSNKDTLLYNSGSGAWFARQLNTGDVSGINNYVLNSETGAFYPASNPNNYATVVDPVRTTVTGNGVTSGYAISGASGLVNPSALIVAIDGILQEPVVDYTVATGTVTFTSPLPSGSKAVIVSPTNTLQVSNMIPADGSVTSAKIVGGVSLSEPVITGGTISSNLSSSTGYSHLNLAGIQRVVLTDDFTTSSLLITLPGFSLPLEANKKYFIRLYVRIRGTSGSVHSGQVAGTFNITDNDVVGMYRRPGFETTTIVLSTTPFAGFGYFNSTGTSNQLAIIEGVFTPSTSGSFIFSCGNGSGATVGSSITIYKGSFLEITLLQ
jgi:hypothetical protein